MSLWKTGGGVDATVDVGGDTVGADDELTVVAGTAAAGVGVFFALGVRGCRGFFGTGGVVLAIALTAWDFGFGCGLGLGVGLVCSGSAVGTGTLVTDWLAVTVGSWDMTSGINGGWDILEDRFFLTSGFVGRSALNFANWSWSVASCHRNVYNNISATLQSIFKHSPQNFFYTMKVLQFSSIAIKIGSLWRRNKVCALTANSFSASTLLIRWQQGHPGFDSQTILRQSQ